MGTLNLTLPDGRSGTVSVGDDFASLSPDRQSAVISDIQAQLAPHNSFSGDLQGGLHDLGTSVSQGLKVAGGVMSRNGMPEWGGDASGAGAWVQSHTPDAPAGPAPSEQLAGAMKRGDWGNVPSLVMHSAVRAAPSAAPIIAAGLLSGPVAAGAVAGATAIGPEAYARAANNGHTEPTTSDVVQALPGAAGQAVGGALLPGGSKLASPVARGAYRVGSDIAGGALMDASGQLGASVGTDQGAKFDPYQTAGAALTQGAIGAARGGREAVGAGIRAGTDGIMSRVAVDAPTSDAQAQSQARVGQLYQEAQAANPNDAPTQTLNTLKQTVARRANQVASDLYRAGLMDSDLYKTARVVINDQALRQNNSATQESGGRSAMLLDDLANSGIDPTILKPLVDGIWDLDTLAPTSFLKNQTGPFRSIAGAVGNVAGAAATLGLGGHLAARVAGPIGGMVDRIAGTATPKITLQSQAANRYLAANGLEAGPNTLEALEAARAAIPGTIQGRLAAAQEAQRQAVAQQSADNFNTLSANDQAALDTQAERDAKVKQAQMDAAWKANQTRNQQIDAAYDANQSPAPEVNDYLSGKLNDPSLLPAQRMTTAQEIALQVQRLRNAQLQAKQIQSQQGVLDQAQGAQDSLAAQVGLGALQDQDSLNNAAAKAQALRQRQIDAAWKANAKDAATRTTQTDAAWAANQPTAPVSADDYLAGKVEDPSLLPPSKLTTAQEIALQSQRLRNAQLLSRQQDQQGKVLQQATNSTPAALGQSALDKLTRQNATTIAAAMTTPTPRPDFAPEAAQAAQDTMRARANRIMSSMDDADLTGNPPDPVPVNTPIRNPATPTANSPASRLQQAQATIAAASANAPSGPPGTAPMAMPPGLPLTAPAAHPQAPLWERLTANGNPNLTRAQVRDAASRVYSPDQLAALDAHTGSVDIPQVIAPIQAAMRGSSAPGPTAQADQPAILSPTRWAAAVNKYHSHVADTVRALRQAGHHEAANATLDIAVNIHSKAAKQAARAALPPEIGKLIPDFVVNQGGS